MRVLYDTSVLIPALLTEYNDHLRALPQLERARQDNDVQGYISTHSMAEIYSVTTRIPKPLKLSLKAAQALILDLLEYLQAVDLSAEDYRQAIAQVVFYSTQQIR